MDLVLLLCNEVPYQGVALQDFGPNNLVGWRHVDHDEAHYVRQQRLRVCAELYPCVVEHPLAVHEHVQLGHVVQHEVDLVLNLKRHEQSYELVFLAWFTPLFFKEVLYDRLSF